MYGLPQSTLIRKQLPKSQIYTKFELNHSERERFDADVSRIDIVAVVSPRTVPAVAEGVEVKEFYLLEVQLKKRDYDIKNIKLLTKLIPQRMVFALRYEDEVQFVIYHTQFIKSEWFLNSSPESGELTNEARAEGKLACIMPCKEEEDEVKVPVGGGGLLTSRVAYLNLQGLNLDAVWDNIVKQIGEIYVEEGNTLTEQIAKDEQRAKIEAKIKILEARMAAERQPRSRREIFETMRELRKQL